MSWHKKNMQYAVNFWQKKNWSFPVRDVSNQSLLLNHEPWLPTLLHTTKGSTNMHLQLEQITISTLFFSQILKTMPNSPTQAALWSPLRDRLDQLTEEIKRRQRAKYRQRAPVTARLGFMVCFFGSFWTSVPFFPSMPWESPLLLALASSPRFGCQFTKPNMLTVRGNRLPGGTAVAWFLRIEDSRLFSFAGRGVCSVCIQSESVCIRSLRGEVCPGPSDCRAETLHHASHGPNAFSLDLKKNLKVECQHTTGIVVRHEQRGQFEYPLCVVRGGWLEGLRDFSAF